MEWQSPYIKKAVLAALIIIIIANFGLFARHRPEQNQSESSSKEYHNIYPVGFIGDMRGGFWAALAFIDKYHDAIEASATVVVAWFTATLWRATDKMWSAGERQLKHSENTSKRQLRAYVGVEMAHINNVAPLPIPAPGEIFEPTAGTKRFPTIGPIVHLTVKNSGQTPARDVVHWCQIDIREFPLTSGLPQRPQPVSQLMSKNDLAAGGQITKDTNLTSPLTDQQIADLRSGTLAIYVHGRITYTDVFDDPWTTDYRFMHVQAAGVMGVSTTLSACSDGNRAT